MNKQQNTKFNYKDPIHLLAIGLGSGLVSKAPGTAGTVMALPLFFLINQLPVIAFWIVLTVATLAGIFICDKTSKDTNTTDDPRIVWDEFCGLWLTLGLLEYNAINIILGFILFRVFDIIKPWPIIFFDKKVKGGFGIMLDDIIAGLFAAICTTVIVKSCVLIFL
jgi:phosphatidylglycerophosphatase A